MPEGRTWESIGSAVGLLVERKQEAYGDSFSKSGEVMRILWPNGIPPERMGEALAMVRVIDKLFRIATHASDPMGEDPWQDVAGYAVLMCGREQP